MCRIESMIVLKNGYFAPPVIIILALICLFVAATIFFNTSLSKKVVNQPAPSPITAPVNWKTYTNPQKTFNIDLPDDFIMTSTASTQMSRSLIFQGLSGTINIDYGSGFGGGCPEEMVRKIKIKSSQADGCLVTHADGSAELGFFIQYEDQTFSIQTNIKPGKEEQILKILETFQPIGIEKF